MAHIYVFSPAGVVLDKVGLRRGVAQLEAMGHEVELDEAVLARESRFAGDDATRKAAFARAAKSKADVVMCSRGGYGITRILPTLPYAAIAKSMARGTKWLGFSDFTALHAAMLSRTASTPALNMWAGPVLVSDLGVPQPHLAMQDALQDVLSDQAEGVGWRMAAKQWRTIEKLSPTQRKAYTRPIHNATLWGGNLCVLQCLLGTPYFPSVEGGILFLEDTAEHPYRIERMLTQMHQAGVLAQQKAIVFGAFSDFKLGPMDKGYTLQSVVDYLRTLVPIPIYTDLPFGHIPGKVCLPVGRPVSLLTQERDVFLLWGTEE